MSSAKQMITAFGSNSSVPLSPGPLTWRLSRESLFLVYHGPRPDEDEAPAIPLRLTEYSAGHSINKVGSLPSSVWGKENRDM